MRVKGKKVERGQEFEAAFQAQALYELKTDKTAIWVCLELPQFCLQFHSHIII